MKIQMSKSESEIIFFDSLCNGLSEVCNCYDLSFVYDSEDYSKAKNKLKSEDPENLKTICFEDVIMEILRSGGKLSLVDEDAEESYSITLQDVHTRVKKTPIRYLLDIMKENDDAETADAVLQTVFCGEIIYG